ncbi:KdpE [Dehalogenimonas sp. WBC-2]|nr:KdpE [Dehalogenimonas sp. WBC-2]
MKKILIIEDDEAVRHLLERCLKADGWQIDTVANGIEALEKVKTVEPHLILLDLILPGIHGDEFLKRLRQWSDVPVIVVSGRAKVDSRISLLQLGADDYLAKPFDINELKARIAAVIRRTNPEYKREPDGYYSDDLIVDFKERQVIVSRNEIKLDPHEFETLRVLVSRRGEIVNTKTLLTHVWGEGYYDNHYLQVVITRLRNKLGRHKSWIANIHGVGYKFLG